MDQSDIIQPVVKQQQAYKKIKVLGQGAMGKAYLVQSSSDKQLYVMKRINIGHLSPQQKQSAMREAQLHSIVHHQNIIAFKEIYHTTKDKLCIIMQYAQIRQIFKTDGDLDQLLLNQNGKFIPQDTILNYFCQICMGLRQIHSKKIIHRDIKAANVFLTKDNKVKIGDFGISKIIDQTVQASKSFVGTPYYLSPEMVEGKPYSTKADIWALGVLLYYMCSQKLPFEAGSLPLLALKILKGSFPPLSGPYSRQLKTLILSMLQVDAKKRPTAADILMKPLFTKYLTKQQSQKLEALWKQKQRLPRNATSANIANIQSPVIGNTIKSTKKQKKPKMSEQQKKLKQKQLRDEKKKKRDQQIKQMRDDIKKKRLQAQKQKLSSSKAIQATLTAQAINIMGKNTSKKGGIQKSPVKSKQQEIKQPVQKPWKSIKNKQGSKRQVEVQIHVPSLKPRQQKKQAQVPPEIDFKIEIKQYGKRPVISQSQEHSKTTQDDERRDQQGEQNEEIESQQEYQHSQVEQQNHEQQEEQQKSENNFQKMMAHLNSAQLAVQGLAIKPSKKIQLYEQSENFDDDNQRDKMQLERNTNKNNKPQMKQMNTLEQQSWNFIQKHHHNSDNLEQCRQILEQGLGQQRFMKAYHVLNQHLQSSEQKKLRGEQLDDYTFNRQVLRKKLDFLTDQEFSDYIVLMYTLIVIQLEEMKKNHSDD